MHKSDLKKTITGMLDNEEIHGYEIQRKLASKGLRLNISYLYRVLAEMEGEGYLEGSREKSIFGPEKKVYRLAKKGLEELDEELKEAVITVHTKYMEYLTKLPPEKSAIRILQRLLDKQTGRGDKILVVAPNVFYDWIISPLCDRFKEGKIYLIKNQSAKAKLECENLTVLDTTVENILLRDSFVDAVRVHGEPKDFPKALNEFHRVLKKDGSLTLIIPYVSPNRNNLPLTMGEFVEKVEHSVSEGERTKPDYTDFPPLLSRYFGNVKSYRVAHLTIFVARGKIYQPKLRLSLAT